MTLPERIIALYGSLSDADKELFTEDLAESSTPELTVTAWEATEVERKKRLTASGRCCETCTCQGHV